MDDDTPLMYVNELCWCRACAPVDAKPVYEEPEEERFCAGCHGQLPELPQGK